MSSRRGLLLGLASCAVLGVSGLGVAVVRARKVVVPPVAAESPGARVSRMALRVPAGPPPGRVLAVMLDPGHGARDNRGNTGVFCEDEQDTMMELAVGVADRLGATGRFVVGLSREPGRAVDYGARLREAADWGADVFVSLHSDVRGRVERWSPAAGLDCPMALDAPGFAVLFADDGEQDVARHRRLVGAAVARRMVDAGFAAYDGADYVGLYASDAAAPGLFADRHALDRRIFVLRRATMPSILVETHNALDPYEATRWTDPETLDAFSGALAAALGDAYPLRDGVGLD